ncbi:MAG: hypothetical protein AAF141_06805 [Pseudomonadota bacterium]
MAFNFQVPHQFKSICLAGTCAFALLGLAACQSSGGKALENIANDSSLQGGTDSQVAIASAPPTVLRDYCPQLELLEPYYEDFGSGRRGDPEKLRFQATMLEAVRSCRVEGNQIVLSVGARGRVITGPTGEPGTSNLPIRIAVRSSDGVLFSELYKEPASIADTSGATRFQFVQDVRVPAPTRRNYKILVGFDSGPPARS